MLVIIWIHGGMIISYCILSTGNQALAELAEKGIFYCMSGISSGQVWKLTGMSGRLPDGNEYLRKLPTFIILTYKKIGLGGESAGAHIGCVWLKQL